MNLQDQLTAALDGDGPESLDRLLARHPELADLAVRVPPPLHSAVLRDQPSMVRCLLDHGADIERRDPDRDTTPLRYAIMYCRTRVIPVLLEHGADAGCVERKSTTALELAEEGAEGVFEEFDDLPRRDAYHAVVEILRAAPRP